MTWQNKAIHPSRRSAANVNHSFFGGDWVIANVRRLRNRIMKPKHRRSFIYLAILIIALIAGFEFQAYFWSRDYARARALRKVTEVCISSGQDPKLLSGPSESRAGNPSLWFEWTYQGQPRHVYRVSFSRRGDPALYGGNPDDPNSAVYEAR